MNQSTIHPSINIKNYQDCIEHALDLGYKFIKYSEVDQHDKFIILRHDIDLCLDCALRIGRIEEKIGVHSTFFIMLHNELYNTLSISSREIIEELYSMGHTIGLHFDPTYWNIESAEDLVEKIHTEILVLSKLVGGYYYVSFHQPSPFILEKELKDEFFESVYNNKYYRDIRYIADSMGMWREESINELIKSQRQNKIQFLCHPIWWFDQDESKSSLQNHLSMWLKRKQRKMAACLANAINNEEKDIILFNPNLE